MPISGPSSYLPTIEEFLAHWMEVDGALGTGGPLVLAGNVLRTTLEDQQADLEAARDKVTDAALDRALARAQLNALITALQMRMVEFNGRIRADLPGSPYARSLPEAFSVGQGESIVREALRTISRLWTRVNAISPVPPGLALPLTLRGGYTRAMFDAERGVLRDAYGALTDAEVALKVAREERNDLQDAIYQVLKNYRLKVPTAFERGHALIDSLPALTPPEGRTPAPVQAHAIWDAPAEKAKLSWAESTDPALKEYEIRAVPGDAYEADDEAVIGNVPAGAPREFATDFGLTTPGMTSSFKVYVMLKTGNERGSEPVAVLRPVA